MQSQQSELPRRWLIESSNATSNRPGGVKVDVRYWLERPSHRCLLSALSNAGYGARHGARVTRRPATGIDLGYEVADDAVEQAWRFEIDGVPAIRHHRESRRWDGTLHQQRRRQARPVLVASENQRRHREAGHLVLQMIQRWTFLLAAELGVGGAQCRVIGQRLLEDRKTARVFSFELHARWA